MPAGATLIVLFGAAVRADGRPSLALRRRIAYAAAAADDHPDAAILCSGAIGREGPSEASVMARELAAAAIDPARLILDEASRDTLQSVLTAARAHQDGGYGLLIACSDGYHLPRIRLMFAALGLHAEAGPVTTAPVGGHRLYMTLREMVATPYDVGLALLRRRRLRARIG